MPVAIRPPPASVKLALAKEKKPAVKETGSPVEVDRQQWLRFRRSTSG
jgi:hypothetical protein